MKDPVHDPLDDSIHDHASIWSSYRRAALRTGQPSNGLVLNEVNSRPRPHINPADHIASVADDHGQHNEEECALAMEKLRVEIKKLRRLNRKKDIVIETLMKKIVKSEKPRAAEHYTFSPLGRSHWRQVSPGTAVGREQSSISSQSTDATEQGHVTASSVHTSKATRNPQTLVIHKGSRYVIHRKKNHLSTAAHYSLCLISNRPDLIRRIEKRQAAISAAAALRHRVAEEKKFAARAVVEGKCSFSNVKNSLFLDPTRITAFPKDEIVNLTKRHLRASDAYRSEVSDERRRVDIAASKIIAQSFSEVSGSELQKFL
ncbi:hypothetical protein OSTOST_21687, partial [Ostertagia ostertagi]